MALPSGYTQLEYIQSSGTQYIDTGLPAKSGQRVEVKFSLNAISGAQNIFGSLDNNTRLFLQHSTATGAGLVLGYVTWSSANYEVLANTVYEMAADFSKGKQSLIVNGATVYTGTDNTDISLTRNAYLLALNHSGSASCFANGRIYYCRIYDGDALLRDYVPALRKRDGAAGLYDRQNNLFYTNAGTGVFTYPGYVAPVEGHNVLIAGTAYEITGGRPLIGGVSYKIAGGQVLVGGVAYGIEFGPPMVTIAITGTGKIEGVPGDTFAKINGVNYVSAATLQVPIGTTVHCQTWYLGYIYSNGKDVGSSNNVKETLHYSFSVQANTTIKLDRHNCIVNVTTS